MTDEGKVAAEQSVSGGLLTFRGRLGRAKFLIGLAAELVLLTICMAALAGLNNPTGGGSVFLGAVCLLTAIYLHLCLSIARQRDIGLSHPVLLGILAAVLPFVWLGLTFEFFNSYWPLVLGGFALFYLGPAIPAGKEI